MTFERLWRNRWLTADAASLGDMITWLRAAAEELEAMRGRGVTMAEDSDAVGDLIILLTDDPAVAQEFGFAAVEAEAEEEEGVGCLDCSEG